MPAHLIDRQIRGCTPDPGAWTDFDSTRLKLWPVTLTRPPAPAASAAAASGAAVDAVADGAPPTASPRASCGSTRAAVYVGTGTVPVRLGDVQPQGKRRMPAADWARGLHADGPPITLGLG